MTLIRISLFVILATFWGGNVAAQSTELDQLFLDLQTSEDWEPIEREIITNFSHSGSDAMDLMLERGWDAINAGDYRKAVEHLSALIDHAPDFAEGYNARATAFYLMGESGLSINDIREVLVRNPRHFGALMGLGFIYEELGDLEGAYAAFKAAQALHPHLPNVNDSLLRLGPEVGGVEL